MLISTLLLSNYRNFSTLNLEFKKGINFLIANNGAGKSNIIEAIQFISTGQSIKTKHQQEIIKNGEELTQIDSEFNDGNNQHQIVIKLNKKGKKILWNTKPLIKTTELLNKLLTVHISPIDDSILLGPPAERRLFLDSFLSKLSPEYLQQLKKLKHTVKLLNFHYKNAVKYDLSLIDLYHQTISQVSQILVEERKKVLKRIENTINRYLNKTTKKLIRLNYYSSHEAINIKEVYEREMRYKESCLGAHRDEIAIFYHDQEARRSISLGERRLLGVLLRWAEKEIWMEQKQRTPILLLDDALLGIDETTQPSLVELITQNVQSIITATTSPKNMDHNEDVFTAFNR